MKATGMAAKVNENWSIDLPESLRNTPYLKVNDVMDIFIGEDDEIILRHKRKSLFRRIDELLEDAAEYYEDEVEVIHHLLKAREAIRNHHF